ncbi:Glutamate--tRNA ligase mitochondrial [Spathaspora sp. JA1]|nr:Glutamate--tRNA ligase mitochondrial [Spathaspora sp. JA1]
MNSFRFIRRYSKISLISKSKTNPLLHKSATASSHHPTTPARTRFAPSPTGFLHLGSLRTALYNYLLAKTTGGEFILRIEDTDQTRLVQGAEENIYSTLKWCGLTIDEGPNEGGQYGPYRQSERKQIYGKYADLLLEKGLAYKCYCSKSRLLELRESAKKLTPPTNVTYDRKCLTSDTSGNDYVIRFKSPDTYDSFDDVLHGKINLQPQYNYQDRRYDDFVIIKADGMPTYHFANVVDDHLMKITHVVRGEEWLPSTPKHIALYQAFNWSPPKFIHIPLLTSLQDKKLSKRSGDLNIYTMKDKGILPEALVNFVALFGWAPKRLVAGESTTEVMDLSEIINSFSIDQLTKGNAKVSDVKLNYLNKQHLLKKLSQPEQVNLLVEEYYPTFIQFTNNKYDKEYLKKVLQIVGPHLGSMLEISQNHMYLFDSVNYSKDRIPNQYTKKILSHVANERDLDFPNLFNTIIKDSNNSIKKKDIFTSLRFAITGGDPGLSVHEYLDLVGEEQFKTRLSQALEFLDKEQES